MLGQSISKNSVLLGIFAAVTTAIIAGTYLGSRDMIKANIRAAEEKALLEIISQDRHDNSMLDDTLPVDDSSLLGLREAKDIYLAKQNGEFVGAIFPATAREGYTGDIDMIVGVNRDGSVAGVRVLQHRETPGLGDAVDRKKSDWVESFVGKSIGNPQSNDWKVKKEGGVFDQFTGATITPRAVIKTVFQTLQYFEQNRDQLIAAASAASATHNEGSSHSHGRKSQTEFSGHDVEARSPRPGFRHRDRRDGEHGAHGGPGPGGGAERQYHQGRPEHLRHGARLARPQQVHRARPAGRRA